VGFLGAGLIFVRRGSVRGLTTAASIWVTAAVGAAAGCGLPVLAALTTGIYFVVAAIFPLVTSRLPRSATAISALNVRYPDGQGILRDVLEAATTRGFIIDDVEAQTLGQQTPALGQDGSAPGHDGSAPGPDGPAPARTVEVTLHVHGKESVANLAAGLTELEDVHAVLATDANAIDE
jgi:putative Mg2+ transporter-C (MgtC) family protein